MTPTAHSSKVLTTADVSTDHEGACIICTARALRVARSERDLWRAKARLANHLLAALAEEAKQLREMLCNIAAQDTARRDGIYEALQRVSSASDKERSA